jgi:Cu(I)-responsive transcriptional regulator
MMLARRTCLTVTLKKIGLVLLIAVILVLGWASYKAFVPPASYAGADLIPPAGRTFANYRLYSDADLHRLRFIKRARSLGFSMKEIAQLLALWSDPKRNSSEVKKLAQSHAAELGRKIAEMQAMQRTLADLARQCHGNDRPECPILDDLARPEPAKRGKASACH